MSEGNADIQKLSVPSFEVHSLFLTFSAFEQMTPAQAGVGIKSV